MNDECQISASCNSSGLQQLFTCDSVTGQYNLLLATVWCCFVAGKVTPDLEKSNGSLPPGLLLKSHVGKLSGE